MAWNSRYRLRTKHFAQSRNVDRDSGAATKSPLMKYLVIVPLPVINHIFDMLAPLMGE
jgi:hypothetical protein